jgi:hypothetical protein
MDPTKNEYGKTIIAYVGCAAICGGGTRFSMVLDNMPGAWRMKLDEGVSDETRDDGSNPVRLPEIPESPLPQE